MLQDKRKPGRPPRVETESSDSAEALAEGLEASPLEGVELEVEVDASTPRDHSLKAKLAEAEAKLKEAEAKISTLAAQPENKKRLIDYAIHHDWPGVDYTKPYYTVKGRMRDPNGKLYAPDGKVMVPVLGAKGEASPVIPVIFKGGYGVTNHRLAARTLSRKLTGGSIDGYNENTPQSPDITIVKE